MWKVSVCVHDCGGTPKNMACRTRHGAGVRGSAQRPHVAPRPARGGGLQQPMGAAPACPPAPGRTGVAAGGRRAASRPARGWGGVRDTRTPLALIEYRYDVPFKFTGKINKLTFNLEPEQDTKADRK